MDRNNIVLEIDAEISRLQQARALLAGINAGKPKPRASAMDPQGIHRLLLLLHQIDVGLVCKATFEQ